MDAAQWTAFAASVLAAWLVGSNDARRRNMGFWVLLFTNVHTLIKLRPLFVVDGTQTRKGPKHGNIMRGLLNRGLAQGETLLHEPDAQHRLEGKLWPSPMASGSPGVNRQTSSPQGITRSISPGTHACA